MKRMIYVLVILLLSFTIYSCAKKSDSSSSSSTTELEGTWKTACYTDSDNYSFYKTPTFAGNVLTITNERHSDTSCATDYRLREESHTFSIGDAGKFLITLGTTKRTPQSSAAVTAYNSASKCSANDWELNTAKTCSWDEGEAGATIYCLYELSGTTLYVKCDGDEQPTSITKDNESTFTKQ